MKMKEIIIYTSDDCPYCSVAEEVLNGVLNEYQGLFKLKSKKIVKGKKTTIEQTPTICIGEEKIEGLPEKEDIHTALFA